MRTDALALRKLHASADGSRRIEYVRRGRFGLTYVIVDRDAFGNEDWAEQNAGEYRWFRLTPSSEEQEFVRFLWSGAKFVAVSVDVAA